MALVTAPAPSAMISNYNQAGGRVTGWIQIVCGVASIIFGTCMWLIITGVIADPSIGLTHAFVFILFGWLSVPVWCGVIFVISGSLGAAAKKDSSCLICGYMAMCIVSIFSASVQLLCESFAAAITKCDDDETVTSGYYSSDKQFSNNDCPQVYTNMTNLPEQQTVGQQVHVVNQPGPDPPAYAPQQLH